MIPSLQTLDFVLPPDLEAGSPPEARGLARDDVKLMVSTRSTDEIVHARFRDLPAFLRPGDVLALNTSGTLNAALNARRADGSPLELHLSTRLPADLWLVEARAISDKGTTPFYGIRPGEQLKLPGGAAATLLTPHARQRAADIPPRLWVARLDLPTALTDYLERHGFPIRYSYVQDAWPGEFYQNVYATEPGSAEMPSAGRAFTTALITRLVAAGVQVAPLILHTGVASLESHEPPYEEYYRVPAETAALVNLAHCTGRRVIAVGTTVVRALETVTMADGVTHPGEGWTTLVITPDRRLRAVDGLITGLHEPKATHLAMLEALAGREHLALTYRAALDNRYLWHEFGDLHLIL